MVDDSIVDRKIVEKLLKNADGNFEGTSSSFLQPPPPFLFLLWFDLVSVSSYCRRQWKESHGSSWFADERRKQQQVWDQ